jgi:hypothetical protein
MKFRSKGAKSSGLSRRFHMKLIVKKALQKLGRLLLPDLTHQIQCLTGRIESLETSVSARSSETQVVLENVFRLMAAQSPTLLPSINEVGFRVHSQFDEDGILLYIFALIGTTDKSCVEICAGDGRECNVANLILNHGWNGHLFDGDEGRVRRGIDFYARHPHTWLHPPRFTRAWITAENVNDLIRASGATGSIDLLSLDVDGVDDWLWKAIEVISPRVVVCEVHNIIPAHLSITVPYHPEFSAEVPDFQSASLAAMAKLAESKGYRLIGTNRFGFNAFFVRDALGHDLLPAVTPSACLNRPACIEAQRTRWPAVEHMNWMSV